MDNKRTNPFRSADKNNFPPLDDFFSPRRPPIHTRSSPDESFCSKSSEHCHDFSMDLSIAGRAAMAEHNYRVRKYGIDGSHSAPNNSMLSDSDDWGKIMDDTCSIASFSSSAFFHRLNGSRDRSRDTDTSLDISNSYFDKSVIQSLLTPEKIRSTTDNPLSAGVTLSRGTTHRTGSPETSSGCCTNISSRCDEVEEMFHAALRFHDDLQESIVSTGDSGKGKSSSVSFALDTSFLSTIDGRGRKKAETEELNFLFGSPINKSDNDESFAINSSFLSGLYSPSPSRISSELKQSPGIVDRSLRHYPLSSELSITTSSSHASHATPLREGKHNNLEDQSHYASILGLTPVKAASDCNDLDQGTPRKNLFQNDIIPTTADFEPETIECTITDDSIELVRHTPKKSHVYDHSSISVIRPRQFGSNASSRFNVDNNKIQMSPSAVLSEKSRPYRQPEICINDENVRGVRLSRASELRALGLESASSSRNSFDPDASVDRSDF